MLNKNQIVHLDKESLGVVCGGSRNSDKISYEKLNEDNKYKFSIFKEDGTLLYTEIVRTTNPETVMRTLSSKARNAGNVNKKKAKPWQNPRR